MSTNPGGPKIGVKDGRLVVSRDPVKNFGELVRPFGLIRQAKKGVDVGVNAWRNTAGDTLWDKLQVLTGNLSLIILGVVIIVLMIAVPAFKGYVSGVESANKVRAQLNKAKRLSE